MIPNMGKLVMINFSRVELRYSAFLLFLVFLKQVLVLILGGEVTGTGLREKVFGNFWRFWKNLKVFTE